LLREWIVAIQTNKSGLGADMEKVQWDIDGRASEVWNEGDAFAPRMLY